MAQDGFGEFLKKTRHDVLPHDVVVLLARRIAEGRNAAETLATGAFEPEQRATLRVAVRRGQTAKEALVENNLRLVVSISRRFRVEGLTQDDLFQEGVLGLMRAVDKFDPDKGWQFSTYATWWIRQAVERAIADKARIIRLPVHVHERMVKTVNAQSRIEGAKGWAGIDDLVDATGLQPSVVREMLRLAPGSVSTDEIIGDGLTTLGDLQIDQHPGPEEIVLEALTAEETARLLEALPVREADVIRLRFGIGSSGPSTLEDIGGLYRVSRERIRQIESKALKSLRKAAGVPESGPLGCATEGSTAPDSLASDRDQLSTHSPTSPCAPLAGKVPSGAPVIPVDHLVP